MGLEARRALAEDYTHEASLPAPHRPCARRPGRRARAGVAPRSGRAVSDRCARGCGSAMRRRAEAARPGCVRGEVPLRRRLSRRARRPGRSAPRQVQDRRRSARVPARRARSLRRAAGSRTARGPSRPGPAARPAGRRRALPRGAEVHRCRSVQGQVQDARSMLSGRTRPRQPGSSRTRRCNVPVRTGGARACSRRSRRRSGFRRAARVPSRLGNRSTGRPVDRWRDGKEKACGCASGCRCSRSRSSCL